MATVVAATSDVLPAAGGSSDDGGALKAGGGEDEEEGKESKETMVLPSQLSPSSVAAFKQCRKLFFYRWADIFVVYYLKNNKEKAMPQALFVTSVFFAVLVLAP